MKIPSNEGDTPSLMIPPLFWRVNITRGDTTLKYPISLTKKIFSVMKRKEEIFTEEFLKRRTDNTPITPSYYRAYHIKQLTYN
jgi:hypothetical protein